ncbi:MAG: C-terminal binding protein [Bacillati bacterium ANGP1]|uniref:C-terminal binding protein n=1 Tax=Candidatus Segetimicrobium genomatis TaxID=2569760 RepID=A0A537J2N3_9BACT|nr:MAG: C-terminal binding protein [Terrabacteria group bacterium ANGP1]
MLKVVITDSVFPSLDIERQALGALDAQVVLLRSSAEADLLDGVTDADALLVCYAPITRRVIGAMDRCRIIARYGIGVDNVDLEAAAAKGIVVTNVPDYCIHEVSDHALALLLACARKVPLLSARVRAGRWEAKDAAPMHRLRGQTLGLVGFGKIPRRLAEKARALGMEIIAFDPYIGAEAMATQGAGKVTLEALLAQSDFVSVHAPLVRETRGLIGEAQLRAMKPTAYLINTARGPLVAASALVRALEEGWIAGAALDVLETEPPARDHPLARLENVILTPHVAFFSEEAVVELQQKAVDEVVRAFSGQPPRSPVNLPRPAPR